MECRGGCAVSLSSTLPLILVFLGQAAPPTRPDERDDPASRLEFMKQSLAVFDVHSAEEPVTKYHLEPEPVFRFANPLGGGFGALFYWLDEEDRPGVIAKVYRSGEGNWGQE